MELLQRIQETEQVEDWTSDLLRSCFVIGYLGVLCRTLVTGIDPELFHEMSHFLPETIQDSYIILFIYYLSRLSERRVTS